MPGDKGGKGKGGKGGKKGGKKGFQHQHHHHHHHHHQHQEMEKKPVFTAEDFPTLVQADGLYEKEIVKYSKEDIIAKLEAFGAKLKKDAALAASMRPDLSGCSLALAKPDYSIELVKPVVKKESGESFADAVKKGGKKVVMSAVDESKPAEKKKEEEPKPKVVKEEPPKEQPATTTPTEDDHPDRKKTFAEAVVNATDVRVPSVPYLQYRAGLSGNTVVAPGGSVQAPAEKEKKGSKGGDTEKKSRKKGEGKGKGAGKKPVMHVDEQEEPVEKPAPTPAPAAAPPAPAPATAEGPTTSWAQVASRLAKDEK